MSSITMQTEQTEQITQALKDSLVQSQAVSASASSQAASGEHDNAKAILHLRMFI